MLPKLVLEVGANSLAIGYAKQSGFAMGRLDLGKRLGFRLQGSDCQLGFHGCLFIQG